MPEKTNSNNEISAFVKPEIIGKILLLQTTIHSLQDNCSLAEFLCRGLMTMPGTEFIKIRIDDCVKSSHSKSKEESFAKDFCDLCFKKSSFEKTTKFIENEQLSGKYFCLPIQSIHLHYGCVLFASNKISELTAYQSFLESLANTVALNLESRANEITLKQLNSDLNRQKTMLESIVAERTKELRIRNHELSVENKERKFAEEKLIQSEKTLLEAQHIGRIGSWEYDVANDKLTWSKQMFEIFGLNPDLGEPIWEEHRSSIHPDDWEILDTVVEDSIKKGTPYNIEFRILHPSFGVKWTLTVGQPEFDNTGKVVKLKGTVQDINEYKLVQEQLKIARDRAEESDRLKSAFLANVSHEIRTPMNGILGFAELLKEPDLTSDQQQEYLEIIEKSGARMLNIINEIIDISKIESNLVKVLVSETNVNEQIEHIYKLFKTETDIKRLQLFCKSDLTEKEAIIFTDREKLYAILINLIKNAIKYTDEGFIEFGCVLDTECRDKVCLVSNIKFYVKDTGIGVPPDRQEAIFERFIQADIMDKMARQGAGLGLAITKAYVEMLGGKIWVESEVGKGSTFYFTLPFDSGTKEKESPKKEISNPIEVDQLKKLKILIAEDDEASSQLISLSIQKIANEIILVKTGTDAVDACRNNPDIELILMDIQMPEMDGYEATRQIRQFNTNVVIIAQTAYALSGDKEKAIEAGCDDYISKPIKKEELLMLMKKYF